SDSQRCLIGKFLISVSIIKKLRLDTNDIIIQKNSYGKPYLYNKPEFHFNISHSGNWVVCATFSQPIGIDIEQIKPIEYSDIAKRYFTKDEYRSLLSADLPDRLSYFYEIWTCKESYIKMIGKGLSIPVDSFSIRLENRPIKIYDNNGAVLRGIIKQYNFDNNYKMAVCVPDIMFQENISVYDIDFIMNNAGSILKGGKCGE
ncbi:MAG: 4'-phosphopantetheinyl transferase superfamily protein, partial [Firmicutes bacterium]|nr:4'-phosphopantetheinyl transferase superfamily protein [Bacillota bacterium]